MSLLPMGVRRSRVSLVPDGRTAERRRPGRRSSRFSIAGGGRRFAEIRGADAGPAAYGLAGGPACADTLLPSGCSWSPPWWPSSCSGNLDPVLAAQVCRAILENGWDEQDVRQELRRGQGRQGLRASQPAGGQDYATQIVRRAYLAVLHREPDANGLRDYGARVVRDRWTQAEVEKALRDSPEYRIKNR
jgi:hypothetical protein